MRKYDFEFTLETAFFQFAMLMGVVTAVVVSMNVGTEYGDGTIRNKLVLGLSRTQIYLSKFSYSSNWRGRDNCMCLSAGVCHGDSDVWDAKALCWNDVSNWDSNDLALCRLRL